MLFEQPVDKVAYYLDLYYQVRCTYELSRAKDRPRPDPSGGIIYTSAPVPPAYPARRRTMNEPTAPEAEAEEDDTSSGADAPPSPQGEGKAPPPGAEEGAAAFPQPRNWRPVAKQGRELHCGKAGQGNSSPKDTADEKARQGRGSKSSGNHHAADAAAEKRRIRERLVQMRAAGLSTPAIIKAANGAITHDQIHDILDAVPVPIAVYRVLDGALETLAAAPPGN